MAPDLQGVLFVLCVNGLIMKYNDKENHQDIIHLLKHITDRLWQKNNPACIRSDQLSLNLFFQFYWTAFATPKGMWTSGILSICSR
jgi:hypothetical protein